jgi:hypothetical protein
MRGEARVRQQFAQERHASRQLMQQLGATQEQIDSVMQG